MSDAPFSHRSKSDIDVDRVYGISDLHVDYAENLALIRSWDDPAFTRSALLVAGDLSDDLERLTLCLETLVEQFRAVFFVPGNHDLWVRDGHCADSVLKFSQILQRCQELGVLTEPARCMDSGGRFWIKPLYSWYVKPEEGEDSLFRKKPGNDRTDEIWGDHFHCRWPPLPEGMGLAEFFLAQNEPTLVGCDDLPVITFSHFLPNQELIFPIDWHRWIGRFVDPMPEFNFSRVAGTQALERQLRQAGSILHLHGHQHRNRHRCRDGVTYVSHCLGYPRERRGTFDQAKLKPKCIWHHGVVVPDPEY